MPPSPSSPLPWPALPWEDWKDTADTLHMMTQIIGKTRLALTPLQNHWWNVPLYVTARGLTTSPMPLPSGNVLEIELDLLRHQALFRHSSGEERTLALEPQTIARFYAAYLETLGTLGVVVAIDSLPCELKTPIRFENDTVHASYDGAAVTRFWQALVHVHVLLQRFSTGFYGKISPVHFFWGSFDLAVTRFCGKRAPQKPGADRIQAEAYSHEVISAGFWPGNGGYGKAAFYCYAAPVPASLADSKISLPGSFDAALGEFVLPYDAVRAATDPAATVLAFLQETYAAAAQAASWDRALLDRHREGAA